MRIMRFLLYEPFLHSFIFKPSLNKLPMLSFGFSSFGFQVGYRPFIHPQMFGQLFFE